jgi:hypothetical protein
VLLSPGTYTGPRNWELNFNGKAIVLTSTHGPDSTTIDGQFAHRIFLFNHGESRQSIVAGVKIYRGFEGAVTIDHCSPTIAGNVIAGSRGYCEHHETQRGLECWHRYGCAMVIDGGSPLLMNNSFTGNSGHVRGAAVYATDTNAEFYGNTFRSNFADECCQGLPPFDDPHRGGAIYAEGGALNITNSVFEWNFTWNGVGGAICVDGGTHVIRNCTFVRNDTEMHRPVAIIDADALIENSIFAYHGYNRPPGAVISCYGTANVTVNCSDFFENTFSGGDNIFCANDTSGVIYLDPMFVDPDNDFRLRPGSPCLPENNVCGVRMGAGEPVFGFDLSPYGVDNTLHVLPGDSVLVRARLTPPPPTPATVDLVVSGSNDDAGPGITDDAGNFQWRYPATSVGIDTIVASAQFALGDSEYHVSSTLVLSLLHPQLVYDEAHHTGRDSVLTVPGGELCGYFKTEPAAPASSVQFSVRGANRVDDSGATDGEGAVSLCYTAAQLGSDTVTAATVFDYGVHQYTATDTVVLISYPPKFVADPAYHRFGTVDTLYTTPEGTLCTHFLTVPPIDSVSVGCHPIGANQGSHVTGWTDSTGTVALCYPAPNEGLDLIYATAFFSIGGVRYSSRDTILVIVVGGETVMPVTDLSAYIGGPDGTTLLVTVNCNKELVDPRAAFDFERTSGSMERTEKLLTAGPVEWTYATTFGVVNPGQLKITVSADDTYGNDTTVEGLYDVAKVLKDIDLDFVSNDGIVGLSADRSIIQSIGRALIERSMERHATTTDDQGSDIYAMSPLFNITTSAEFLSSPRLTIRHYHHSGPVPTSDDIRKIGIYSSENGAWHYVGGQGASGAVSAAIEIPGLYAAFFNPDHHVVPVQTVLYQNHPNPFNPATRIVFDLHQGGNTQLHVYDVTGRRVRTLMNEYLDAGVYETGWDGWNDNGDAVSSGVYFYRLLTESEATTKKMVLIR